MPQLNSARQPLLNYQQLGQGEDIILIHGLFGSLENLNAVAKTLARDFKVTSIDVRNHGNSFHKEDMDYSILALDVINLLNHLNIDSCYLLGHSMGGKIAIQVALEHNLRVKKLIVADIAPVNYPPHHTQIISGLESINLGSISKRQEADLQLSLYVDNISIRQFLLRNLACNSQGDFYFKCSIANISKGYQQIMQANVHSKEQSHSAFLGPTLFIKGANSDYILPKHKLAILKLLPNSKAKVIQGTGHWLHVEKPNIFNKIVTDFISDG